MYVSSPYHVWLVSYKNLKESQVNAHVHSIVYLSAASRGSLITLAWYMRTFARHIVDMETHIYERSRFKAETNRTGDKHQKEWSTNISNGAELNIQLRLNTHWTGMTAQFTERGRAMNNPRGINNLRAINNRQGKSRTGLYAGGLAGFKRTPPLN